MSFPINFVRSSGRDDFITPLVNFTGNAAVVAVGGISVGVIAYLALKALGISFSSSILITAIPVTIALFGIGAAVVGASVVAYLFLDALS